MSDLFAEQDLPGLDEVEAPVVSQPRKGRDPDLVVILPGVARGKGRHRTRVINPKGGGPAFATQYPDKETANYEALLRYGAEQAMREAGVTLMAGELKVDVQVFIAPPKSWSNKKRAECLAGLVRPTGKPDADNFLKMLDAFNGIVWKDDSAIVDARCRKFYREAPAFEVRIWHRRGIHS